MKRLLSYMLTLMLGCTSVTAFEQKYQYLPEMETVELSPQMRPEPLSASIYELHADEIATYIENVLIFDSRDQYETLPYIVGFDRGNQMGATGDRAYTKGLTIKNNVAEYSLLSRGNILTHPVTGQNLGIEAFVVGRAVVQEFAPTQTILITDSTAEMEINTRLTPLVGIDLPGVLEVKYPPKEMSGYILAVQQDNLGGGGYSPVIISLGRCDGLRQGHVLNVTEDNPAVPDTNTGKDVILPREKIGEVLMYKIGDKISLGIITTSDRMIVANDRVYVSEQDF